MAEMELELRRQRTHPSMSSALTFSPATKTEDSAPPAKSPPAARDSSRRQADVPASVREVLSKNGQPLDAPTRAFMEPRFGHDFGQVRVHADAAAAESARAVRARAYTVSGNIVFGDGEFSPHTARGSELLAHELAHTVQQRTVSGDALGFTDPDEGFEASANAAARAVANGAKFTAAMPACSSPRVQRKPAPDAQWKNDVRAARYRGRLLAERVRKHGKLSTEARAKANSELAYFEGAARDAYIQEIKPALAPFVEVEMPEMAMRPAPPPKPPEKSEQQREYEGMAAYYASTRQSQLDARAAQRAKYRDEVHRMDSQQIYSEWEAGKEAFVEAASSPNHGLNADQLFEIWLRHWDGRWKAGRETSHRIVKREADADWGEYYSKIVRFDAGERDALGPEYARAVADEAAADAMFRQSLYVKELLWAADSAGRSFTLAELNHLALLHDNVTIKTEDYALAAMALAEAAGGMAPKTVSAAAAEEASLASTATETEPATTTAANPKQGVAAEASGVPEPILEEAPTQPLRNPAEAGGEQVGDFRVTGEKRLNGTTFEREIGGLRNVNGKTTDVRPILQFFKDLLAEAKAAGATRLRIRGQFIVNKNVLRMSRIVERFGGTVEMIDSMTIEINLPVN